MKSFSWLERISRGGLSLRDSADQLRDYIYALSDRAFAQGDADRDSISDTVQLDARRAYVRRCFLESVGALPPSDTPLQPRTTGCLPMDGFRVEKIIYESRPAHYVTANLYIPDGLDGPSGAVLFLCGHHTQGKHVDTYQTACQYLARAGLIVLAQDPVGQGERWSYYDPARKLEIIESSCPEHDYAGFQSLALGESIAAYFLYDAMRGLDFLASRPEVDPARIGVTGNSGGATQAAMLMLCDDRIAAAAPATFIMSRRAYLHTGQALQDCEQIWPALSARGIDHEDILLAMAPKPLLVLAATDDFFPIESTQETVRRVRRFWEMYGLSDHLSLYADDTKHHFSPALAARAAAFFAKHLLGRQAASIEAAAIRVLPGARLWCTRCGQVSGDYPDARFVYDVNQELLDAKQRQYAQKDTALRRKETTAFLREKILQNRTASPLHLKRAMSSGHIGPLFYDAHLWYTQAGMVNYGLLFRALEQQDHRLPVTIALWEGGTAALQAHADFLHSTCGSGRALFVLDVSGSGALAQRSLMPDTDPADFGGTLYKLAYDLIWLGDSLAALRVYDLLRCLDVIDHLAHVLPGDIRLFTEGRCSVYADIARFLDARITETASALRLESFASLIRSRYYDPWNIAAFVLPGLMDHADLDTLRAWSAGD